MDLTAARPRRLAILITICCAACRQLPTQRAGLELQSPTMAADGLLLEAFLVRLAGEEAADIDAIWADVDEMALPVELRERLAARGFRAGTTGGKLPAELERLMRLAETSGKPTRDTAIVDFTNESRVTRRTLQMRSGGRGEIVASKTYPALPLFEHGADRAIGGQVYQNAQCCIIVSGTTQPDGCTQLHVSPEVQHGEPRSEFIPGDGYGYFSIETRRNRVTLDELQMDADLRPGQVLVLGATTDAEGKLAAYFFSEEAAGAEVPRLLLLRLAQSQRNALFDEQEVGVSANAPQ